MLPITASSRHPRQALARRLYPARIVGLALGMLAVAAAWRAVPPAWPWWMLLALNGLGWPHLARYLATRVRDPHRTERHCLLIDGLLTGFWVAAVDFAPIPGAVLIALYNLGTIAVGGPRLLAAGSLAWLAGGGVGALIWPTLDWQLLPTPLALLGALPLLLLYPLMIGWRSYRQACQLVEQKRRETRQRRTDALTGLYNRAHWERVIESHFDTGRPPCAWRCWRSTTSSASTTPSVTPWATRSCVARRASCRRRWARRPCWPATAPRPSACCWTRRPWTGRSRSSTGCARPSSSPRPRARACCPARSASAWPNATPP
ncbi:hypothetical protein KGQ90_10300 [Modicisalibacter tunisiensis]|nr:hypothetical protein [Modicisalibacter tunisiensis]